MPGKYSRSIALLTIALTCAACDDGAGRERDSGALEDSAFPPRDAAVDVGSDGSTEAGSKLDAGSDAARDAELALLPVDAFVPEKVCGEAGVVIYAGSSEMGCTWLRGILSFENYSEPTLPASVRTIERIDERLNFFRPFNLTNLRGFDRLRRVGGGLWIRLDNASKLTSLEGLGSLREVGELRVESNGGLTSLAGLSALETVAGDLTIHGNRALPKAEVDALLKRVRVGGATWIGDNGP